MKNVLVWTRIVVTCLCVSAFSVAFTACQDDDEGKNTNEVKYENVPITGIQEVPAVTTASSGTFSGTYNKTTKVLTYNITHTVASPTAAHFHEAPRDSSGPVVIPIAPPVTSPINNRTATLTTAQESDLLKGRLYVNIHSTAFPAGEIRGQIPAQ